MNAHTPGPWHFDNQKGIIYAADEQSVILVNTACAARDVALIAAAPDLLAFAHEFIRAWAGPGATDSPLEAQARAAIAKAEGKS